MGAVISAIQGFFAPQPRTSASSTSSAAASPKMTTFLRSAVQYKPILSNFDDNDSPREPRGNSLFCGPVNKKLRQQRLKVIESSDTKQTEESDQKVGNRKMIIVRHGERMDSVFLGWLKLAFSETSEYKPYDLNMPATVPPRVNNQHFTFDTPVTELGNITSQMIGRTMRMSQFIATQIYSSPALRCLQTAHDLQKMCRRDYSCKINIEPGLFEFLGWYDECPEWLTKDEMLSYGYDINVTYKPIITAEELKLKYKSEAPARYYQRSHTVIQAILKGTPSVDKTNILIVAHAPSIDACSRKLLGRQGLPAELDAKAVGLAFPYLCTLVLQESTDKSWTVVDKMLPNISYYEQSNRIDGSVFNRS